MSLLNTNVSMGVRESLPAYVRYEQRLSNKGICKSRYTAKSFPTGATEFSSAGIKTMNFRINSQDFLDATTLTLNFNAGCAVRWGGVAANEGANSFNDNIASIIKKVTVMCAGETLEEIDNFNMLSNMLTYASVPKQYYDHQLSVAEGAYGLIPKSKAGFVVNGTPLQSNINWPLVYSQGSNDLAIQRFMTHQRYSLSLSLLGISRTSNYLPIRGMPLTLQIELEDYKTCCVHYPTGNGAGAVANTDPPAANQNYVVNDVYLTYDCVVLDGTYTTLIDKLMASNRGLALHFNTWSNQNRTFQASQNSLLISKGVSHLKSVMFGITKLSDLTNTGVQSLSTFLPLDFANGSTTGDYQGKDSSIQLTIGSRNYGLDAFSTPSVIYTELNKMLHQHANIEAGGCINWENWNGFKNYNNSGVPVAGSGYWGVGYDSGVASGPAFGAWGEPEVHYDQAVKNLTVMGFNLEAVMNSEALVGIDTRSQGGFNIMLKLNWGANAPADPMRLTCFVHYDKAVVLRNNTVQVSE